MKNTDVIREYEEYQKKIGNRKELYKVVATRYEITSALYPGSHIDITPSLVIPRVVYVDNFKGTIDFFKKMELIEEYINENKEYEVPCDIVFIGQDYTEDLNIEPVDLIISQYAGFVGKATKNYLRSGGILLSNDSHGDATIARFDKDFEFIGTIGWDNRIINDKLDDYFLLPRNRSVDLEKVYHKMKGPKYKLTAENYLFRKI